jgi:hypothetical protein
LPRFWLYRCLLVAFPQNQTQTSEKCIKLKGKKLPEKNKTIIATSGIRWQEVFDKKNSP